jgi:replication factor C small subunit
LNGGVLVKIEQSLWVEKYRPKSLKDVVLPDEYKQEFMSFLNQKEIPNLLFSGPAGGGKTTLARVITSKEGVINYRDQNLLEINGSAKETRGINFVSDVIEPFMKIPPAGGDKYKILFIDEGDNLTEASFKSLRGVIEKYQTKYGRFILTCNYLSKIPDPVQSRFTPYIFKQIPLEFVYDYCANILNSEKVKFEEPDLKFVVESLYPDVRKTLNAIQRMSLTGKFKVNKDIALTSEKAIIGAALEISKAIKNKENHKINKLVGQIVNILDKQDLEFKSVYEQLFFTKDYPVPAKIVTNKYSNSHQSCLVPSMHFMSMILEMINALQAYYASIK